MDSSEDVAFRHTALERENRELLGSLKNLTELKSRAELENKELQATLEKLQAKLVPCSTAEIIKNPRDNASSKKGGLKTNSSVANGAHRLNRNNPNSLPQLSTPRRNVENPKPSVDDILQMKFPDVFPPTEDKTMRMSSKHFTTQASRQSMNVEKLLRRHEQLVQGSVSQVLSAVKSDLHWCRKKADPQSSSSSISAPEYDLDGRLMSKAESIDPMFFPHCSIPNLVHWQQQQVLASKLEEISEYNKVKVLGAMAQEIESSYPKSGFVAEKLADRAQHQNSENLNADPGPKSDESDKLQAEQLISET